MAAFFSIISTCTLFLLKLVFSSKNYTFESSDQPLLKEKDSKISVSSPSTFKFSSVMFGSLWCQNVYENLLTFNPALSFHTELALLIIDYLIDLYFDNLFSVMTICTPTDIDKATTMIGMTLRNAYPRLPPSSISSVDDLKIVSVTPDRVCILPIIKDELLDLYTNDPKSLFLELDLTSMKMEYKHVSKPEKLMSSFEYSYEEEEDDETGMASFTSALQYAAFDYNVDIVEFDGGLERWKLDDMLIAESNDLKNLSKTRLVYIKQTSSMAYKQSSLVIEKTIISADNQFDNSCPSSSTKIRLIRLESNLIPLASNDHLLLFKHKSSYLLMSSILCNENENLPMRLLKIPSDGPRFLNAYECNVLTKTCFAQCIYSDDQSTRLTTWNVSKDALQEILGNSDHKNRCSPTDLLKQHSTFFKVITLPAHLKRCYSLPHFEELCSFEQTMAMSQDSQWLYQGIFDHKQGCLIHLLYRLRETVEEGKTMTKKRKVMDGINSASSNVALLAGYLVTPIYLLFPSMRMSIAPIPSSLIMGTQISSSKKGKGIAWVLYQGERLIRLSHEINPTKNSSNLLLDSFRKRKFKGEGSVLCVAKSGHSMCLVNRDYDHVPLVMEVDHVTKSMCVRTLAYFEDQMSQKWMSQLSEYKLLNKDYERLISAAMYENDKELLAWLELGIECLRIGSMLSAYKKEQHYHFVTDKQAMPSIRACLYRLFMSPNLHNLFLIKNLQKNKHFYVIAQTLANLISEIKNFERNLTLQDYRDQVDSSLARPFVSFMKVFERKDFSFSASSSSYSASCSSSNSFDSSPLFNYENDDTVMTNVLHVKNTADVLRDDYEKYVLGTINDEPVNPPCNNKDTASVSKIKRTRITQIYDRHC